MSDVDKDIKRVTRIGLVGIIVFGLAAIASIVIPFTVRNSQPKFHYKDTANVVGGFYKGAIAQVVGESSSSNKYICKLYFAVDDPDCEVIQYVFNPNNPQCIATIKASDLELIGYAPEAEDNIFVVKLKNGKLKNLPIDYD